MIDIINGSTSKPASVSGLISFFKGITSIDGILYIGYPIIGTGSGAYSIDAMLISPQKGLIIFDLIENKDISNYRDTQDECANRVEAKLKFHKELTNRRKLKFNINVITYAPSVINITNDKEYPICNNSNDLEKIIEKIEDSDFDCYRELVSVLQTVSNIRKNQYEREIKSENSKGSKIYNLEKSISNLDYQQNSAVIETVEGVQRIRGLAGSGKTIVLALKAAYLHSIHPDWKIAVTFNTRSLKAQFKSLINNFYIENASQEPNWNLLNIIHAWGSSGGEDNNGIYYTFCEENNVYCYDYKLAKKEFGSSEAFEQVCNKALQESKSNKEIYDAILIDEAQDFSPSFLQLCYSLLKSPKRLVYAYDELQNLRLQSLPSPEILFGKDLNNNPKVKFLPPEEGQPKQDIILKKCYRNSRPLLVTAHSLGFGIYHKPVAEEDSGLIQMFEQSMLWRDIGYENIKGEICDGVLTELRRTSDTSPVFLEDHSEIDDLIIFKKFETKEEQDEWVANEIIKNLNEDELQYSDIIVINPNPLTTKQIVSRIRTILFNSGINNHTAGVDTSPDVFFKESRDSITFSGIYRAKGNEAAMVYVVNADYCGAETYNLARRRNELFTAITRSKAWVRVVGVGENMQNLINEYLETKNNNFTLKFIYPTQQQREHMNLVNRDMSEVEKQSLQESQKNIISLIDYLKSGKIQKENLNPNDIKELLKLLNNDNNS